MVDESAPQTKHLHIFTSKSPPTTLPPPHLRLIRSDIYMPQCRYLPCENTLSTCKTVKDLMSLPNLLYICQFYVITLYSSLDNSNH